MRSDFGLNCPDHQEHAWRKIVSLMEEFPEWYLQSLSDEAIKIVGTAIFGAYWAGWNDRAGDEELPPREAHRRVYGNTP